MQGAVLSAAQLLRVKLLWSSNTSSGNLSVTVGTGNPSLMAAAGPKWAQKTVTLHPHRRGCHLINLKESQWLRVTLDKWLDDEYCPEKTNIVISKVAANSYYNSLLEKRTDLADILLNMARELESISYKESFHGAFSSANAAVNLIARRIELS